MPFFADLPPQLQERVVCSISAAVKYEVPVNIVLAVAEKEGGKPGQWVRNSNGTHDVGPMQFNTASGPAVWVSPQWAQYTWRRPGVVQVMWISPSSRPAARASA